MTAREFFYLITPFSKSIFFALTIAFSKSFSSLFYITLFFLILATVQDKNLDLLDYSFYHNWVRCIVQDLGSVLCFIGIQVSTSLLSEANS